MAGAGRRPRHAARAGRRCARAFSPPRSCGGCRP
nr:MAG TPA: hypothetical protein [Caudoviricetes sp.]